MTAAETTPQMTNKTAIAAAELRLGNYVKAPLGEIMRIDVLGHLDNPDYIHASNETGFGQNGFEPIELTPEILEKAGFYVEKETTEIHKRFELTTKTVTWSNWDWIEGTGGFDITFTTNNKDDKVAINTKYKCPVKHLHEIQNLFWIVTGEELPLTL